MNDARCRTCNQPLAGHMEKISDAELARWLAERKAKAQGELEAFIRAEEIMTKGE